MRREVRYPDLSSEWEQKRREGTPIRIGARFRRDDPPRRERVRSRDATYPRRVYPALSSSPPACAGAILLAHLVRETPPRAA